MSASQHFRGGIVELIDGWSDLVECCIPNKPGERMTETAKTKEPEHGPTDSTLRLAIAMRGGVSLAIWIGGALAEIDRLRRASIGATVGHDQPSAEFLKKLLAITRFERVEIDILTGASAGGLNAALGAACLAVGAPIAGLKNVWMDTADIDSLLDHDLNKAPTPTDVGHRQSVLNGDYFRAGLEERFSHVLRRGAEGTDPNAASPSQAFLALTVFGGVPVRSPADPKNLDRRHSAFGFLRHEADSPGFSDFLVDENAPIASKPTTVARATAGFPVAFEAISVQTNSLQGVLHLPDSGTEPQPTTVRMYDGGVVDNIPVARAIRAVGPAPATGPTRRWVLFLHPSPEEPREVRPTSIWTKFKERLFPSSASKIPSPLGMIKDLSKAAAETLLDDLEVLIEHNRSVEVEQIQAIDLLRNEFSGAPGLPSTATIDADRLYEVILSPASALARTPIGQDAPPSPIFDWNEDSRFQLRMAILNRALESDVPVRPFAQLARIGHFLIERIRWVERYQRVELSHERRTVYDLAQLATLVNLSIENAMLGLFPVGSIALQITPYEAVNFARSRAAALDADPRLVALANAAGVSASETSRLPWINRLHNVGLVAEAATLHQLATGTFAATVATFTANPSQVTGLQEAFQRSYANVATTITGAFAPGAKTPTSIFTVVHLPFAQAADVDEAAERVAATWAQLVRVDVALSGLHKGGTSARRQTLNYMRISGANRSPLAEPTSTYDLPSFSEDRKLGLTDGQMSPKAKLSGNALGNFSGFLSRRFRENDWMWGRMDAATTIVDLLIRRPHLCLGTSSDPSPAEAASIVASIVAALQSPGPAQSVFADLTTRLQLIEADVAAILTRTPGSGQLVKDLLVARWHLDVLLSSQSSLMAAKLLPDDDAPVVDPAVDVQSAAGAAAAAAAAAAPPATVEEVKAAIARYEDTPRQFTDIWGSRRVAVRGVQTARHLSGALLPRSPTIIRNVAAAPLMVLAGVATLRGKFLLGINLAILAVPIPALTVAWRVSAIVASAVLSTLYWWFVVRRKSWDKTRMTGSKKEYRRQKSIANGVGLLSLGLHVATVTTLLWKPQLLVPVVRSGNLAERLFESPSFEASAAPIVVGSALTIAMLLLWQWARLVWRIPVALFVGAMFGFWVWVSEWTSGGEDTFWDGFFGWFHGRPTPFVLTLLVTTWIATFRKPEYLVPDQP